MKKFLFPIAAIMLMVSCAGNKESEKAREDSVRVADSIAQVEAAEAAAEEARQDSIRQDSIQKAVEFASVVKALERIPDENNKLDGFLKSLGFKGNVKKSTRTEDYLGDMLEYDVETYNYTYSMGDKKITYFYKYEESIAMGSSETRITIEGDDQALDDFYRFAKKKFDSVSKKGNTVVISDGWA